MNDNVIIGANLSEVWARALLRAESARGDEVIPLVSSFTTTFGIAERHDVRAHLERMLAECGESAVDTVASTIFPCSLWNPACSRDELYRRYDAIWPRLERVRANNRGTYFRRFYSFGDTGVNQIEHVLQTWAGGNHRRSALQLAVFDPTRDHVDNRQLGFPCLHQVAVVPGHDGGLSITGFYGMQTLFEKAYGNYLGLARLGMFLAHELDMPLRSVTCVASVGKLSQSKEFTANRTKFCRELASLLGETR